MDENEYSQRQYTPEGRPIEQTFWQKIKKFLAPVGAVFIVLFKYLGSLKFLLPFLKTGGTMLLSIWAYAIYWGWKFAVGFVLLIFVHECGHMLAAKKVGLKVSAPAFIPFMGALITLKEAPRNAWIEAQVGIGGPMLGAFASAVCVGIYFLTDNPLFLALAYTGFFLNLFNLAPISPLDGGRIVTALSPWLWILGFAIIIFMVITRLNSFNPLPLFIFGLILLSSRPRLFSVCRKKTAEEQRYFEVTPVQRASMAAMYFGLILFLIFGMDLTHIRHDTLQQVQ